MGLRDREPEPLRNDRQSSSGSDWNRGISAHGCAGVSRRLPIVAGTGTLRVGIFSLPRAYRKRHSWSVVRVLRDLIGHDFVGDITGVRNGPVTVAAAPARGAGSWVTMNELGKLLFLAGLILAAGGLILMLFGRTNLPIGRLPGDIIYRGKNTTFYFPLATSILLSVVLSVILYLVGRLKR
jgi:hypothetical protein